MRRPSRSPSCAPRRASTRTSWDMSWVADRWQPNWGLSSHRAPVHRHPGRLVRSQAVAYHRAEALSARLHSGAPVAAVQTPCAMLRGRYDSPADREARTVPTSGARAGSPLSSAATTARRSPTSTTGPDGRSAVGEWTRWALRFAAHANSTGRDPTSIATDSAARQRGKSCDFFSSAPRNRSRRRQQYHADASPARLDAAVHRRRVRRHRLRHPHIDPWRHSRSERGLIMPRGVAFRPGYRPARHARPRRRARAADQSALIGAASNLLGRSTTCAGRDLAHAAGVRVFVDPSRCAARAGRRRGARRDFLGCSADSSMAPRRRACGGGRRCSSTHAPRLDLPDYARAAGDRTQNHEGMVVRRRRSIFWRPSPTGRPARPAPGRVSRRCRARPAALHALSGLPRSPRSRSMPTPHERHGRHLVHACAAVPAETSPAPIAERAVFGRHGDSLPRRRRAHRSGQTASCAGLRLLHTADEVASPARGRARAGAAQRLESRRPRRPPKTAWTPLARDHAKPGGRSSKRPAPSSSRRIRRGDRALV